MRGKSALLMLFVLLLSLFPSAPAGRSLSVYFGTGSNVGLGFGPSSVQPISMGTPIFTQGDNLWVEWYQNSTVEFQLFDPSAHAVTPVSYLGPGQLLQLYAFGRNDSAGSWKLQVNSTVGPFIVEIPVQSPTPSLMPAIQSENLTGNQLDQQFTVPQTDSYDIQACSTGASMGDTAHFGQSGGPNGTIAVTLYRNQTDLALVSVSQIATPVTTWLELYSQYSYSEGDGTASQSLLVASTQPTTFTSAAGSKAPQTESLPLSLQMPLRSGRFDLRVFERAATGLSLQQAQFLREVDGSWLSLGDCTSLVNVNSQSFTLSANLDAANSSWPRGLIIMYALNGTESYSTLNLPGTVARLLLSTAPVSAPLNGVVIAPSAPGCGLREWAELNSAVYLLMDGYPCTVSLGLSFTGVSTWSVSAAVPRPYSSESVLVPAGNLSASVTMGGAPFLNATLSVAPRGGEPVVVAPSGSGGVSMLLPPGNYTLTATYAGKSVSEGFAVSAGKTTAVTLELSPPGFPVTLAAVSLVGLVGVVVNIVVWRRYLERRKISL